MDNDREVISGRIDPEDSEWLDERGISRSEAVRRGVKKLKEDRHDDRVIIDQRISQLESEIEELQVERDSVEQKIENKRAEKTDLERRKANLETKLDQIIREYLDEPGELDPHKDGVNAGHVTMERFADKAGVSPQEAYERYVEAYDLHKRSEEVFSQ